MRKMKVFFIAILLLILCGCSKQEPIDASEVGGEKTLHIMLMGGNTSQALRRISDAASEISMEKLGCRVELHTISLSEYSSQLNKLQLDGELPDIFVSESKSMLAQLIDEKQVLCLNNYLLEYTKLTEEITSRTEWENVSLNGDVYAIPFNTNNEAYRFAFAMRADICAELGIRAEAITNLDQLHDILQKVKASYPDIIAVVPNFAKLSPSPAWDTVSNRSGDCNVGVIPYRDKAADKLELITDVPEFWDWCRYMYSWNQEGLLMKDICFNQEPHQTLIQSGVAFGYFTRYTEGTAINQSINLEQPPVYAMLSGERVDYSENGLSFCIAAETEMPETSMEFLQLLYTDTELLSLCVYGQEGIDYTRLDDGSIRALNNSDAPYVITRWCWPNTSSLDDVNKEGIASTENIQVSPAAGVWFDNSNFESEANACNKIMGQYYQALISGMLDPDIAIPKMRAELIEAGAMQVIEEQQLQLDKYMSENQ